MMFMAAALQPVPNRNPRLPRRLQHQRLQPRRVKACSKCGTHTRLAKQLRLLARNKPREQTHTNQLTVGVSSAKNTHNNLKPRRQPQTSGPLTVLARRAKISPPAPQQQAMPRRPRLETQRRSHA
jgi:ribosomal protein S14